MTRNQTSTSDTGGWCNTATRIGHKTDKQLVHALVELFAGCTVVGLGDGRGEYRRLILQSGNVRRYDAYDGAPNIRTMTSGQVMN